MTKSNIRNFALVLLLGSMSACSFIVRNNIYAVASEKTISLDRFPGSQIVRIDYNYREVQGLFYEGGDRLVVIFHAAPTTLNGEIPTAIRFAERKNSVLLIEYPGYGVSKKYRPEEADIYDDAEALLLQVQRKGNYYPDRTSVYGISLGAAVAIEMVRREHATKLICVAPFTSMHDLLHKRGIPAPIEALINSQSFNNLRKAPDIECPVLIVSGKGDRTAPHSMALRLSEVFPNCELLALESDRHYDIYKDFSDATWKRVLDF